MSIKSFEDVCKKKKRGHSRRKELLRFHLRISHNILVHDLCTREQNIYDVYLNRHLVRVVIAYTRIWEIMMLMRNQEEAGNQRICQQNPQRSIFKITVNKSTC